MRGAIIALALALIVGLTSCAQECPAALLEGTLTEQDGDLVVITADDVAQRVHWSASGYEVRADGDRLVIADWLGAKAGEGDFVSLGGGEFETGVFRVCGRFENEPIVGQ